MSSREEVEKTLRTMFREGDVIELRVLGMKGEFNDNGSGYYQMPNDVEAFINDALSVERREGTHQCFVTINALNRDVLHRRRGLGWRIKSATTDSDVIRRRWLLIDFDPKRTTGISSTDEEKDLAYERMEQVREWLGGLGFPEPTRGDSGNGYHLLYPLDFETDPSTADRENSRLINQFLTIVNERFGDNSVSIDRKVFNAARVSKVYGTWARKGVDTEDRPHRKAKLITVPERTEPLEKERLESFVSEYGGDDKTKAGDDSKQWIEHWLDKYDIGVQQVKEESKGTRYVLRECPFNSTHGNHGSEAYVFKFENGAIVAACSHDSCTGLGWPDLRERYEPEYVRPQAVSDSIKKWWESKKKRQNQEQLAELFVKEIRDEWRYTPELNQCVRYNGQYWEEDDSDGRIVLIDFINDLIELISSESTPDFSELGKKEAAKKLKSWSDSHNSWLSWIIKQNNAGNQEGILRIAKPKARISLSEFDNHDYLLNCKNGTINLRSGKLQEHSAGDHLTLMIPVNYNPTAVYERWDQFLLEAVGRPQYVRYLQKETGYCLTGSTKEEIIIILYGEESTGKSTFYEPIMRVMGAGDPDNAIPGYGNYMNFDTLKQTSKNGGSAREDILRLRPARAVMCSEIEKDTVFNTALGKKIASGEPLVARGNYARHSIEYSPRFKVIIGTNYMPIIPYDDSYRRYQVHPFVNAFEGAAKDKNLKQEFLKNAEAKERILAWLVEGCLLWQKEGLDDAPREVTRANADYRKSQNPLTDYLDDYCVFDPHGSGRDNPDSRLVNLLMKFNGDKSYYGGSEVNESTFGKFMSKMGFKGKRTTDKERRQFIYFEEVRLKTSTELADGLEFRGLEEVGEGEKDDKEHLETCAPSPHNTPTWGQSEVVRIIENEFKAARDNESPKSRAVFVEFRIAAIRRNFPDLISYPLEELIEKLCNENGSEIQEILAERTVAV